MMYFYVKLESCWKFIHASLKVDPAPIKSQWPEFLTITSLSNMGTSTMSYRAVGQPKCKHLMFLIARFIAQMSLLCDLCQLLNLFQERTSFGKTFTSHLILKAHQQMTQLVNRISHIYHISSLIPQTCNPLTEPPCPQHTCDGFLMVFSRWVAY